MRNTKNHGRQILWGTRNFFSIALIFLFFAPARFAAADQTITVTDGGSGAGSSSDVTLAYAITQANAFSGGTTTINFSGVSTVTLPTTGSGQLFINGNVTINGGSGVTINGENNDRIFFVAGGTVNLNNLTLQNGNATGGSGGQGGAGAGLGGAIFVADGKDIAGSNVTLATNVTLNQVNFLNNGATGGSTNGGGGSGGGMGGTGLAGGGGFGNGANGGIGAQPGSAGAFLGGASGGGGSGGANGGGGGGLNGGGGGGGGGVGGGSTNGGFGGGGSSAHGGNGGFGGGGGNAISVSGGNGGFGGGGGTGGFGLGPLPGGTGGFGGGAGGEATTKGGAGLGAGGAVFVQSGANLTVTGGSFTGDFVIAGQSSEGGGNGEAFGSGVFLNGSGTLNFTPGDGQMVTVSDAIADQTGNGGTGLNAGSWGININGTRTGSVAFSGNNTYSGGTTLTAGTLIAGSSAAFGTGPMQVNGGTLTVGNGNHMISVNSYAQSGGTLLLNVAGNGQTATADQLHVTNTLTGPASLGGNLTVNFSGFTVPNVAHNTTYTFNLVHTDAGYIGTFATFDPLNLGNGLMATLDYTTIPDDVLLQISQGVSTFVVTGLTPNQQAIVGSINTGILAGNGSPNSTALIAGLAPFSTNPEALGEALNQLSPQAFGQFTSVTAFNNASFGTEAKDQYAASQRGGPNGTFIGGNGRIDASGLTLNDPSYAPTLAMIHSRLVAWNAAPLAHGLLSDSANPLLGGVEMKDLKSMAAPAAGNPWNFFVRGNVILAQGFSNPDVSHFDDNTESVGVGADYRITPNFLVGLTAGYGHTDVTLDNNDSSATVDSYSPGIYASYANKGWYANFSGDYVHNAYTQSRVIGFLGQTATSAPEGNEGIANLDGGYDFHHGDLAFGPLAGLQYTHLTVNGYTESGSVADLTVNDQNADSLRSRLGGRLTYSLVHCGITFTPHLDATWQHEFMDQSRGITSQFSSAGLGSFSVKTDNPSRDSALVNVGLDAAINQTVTVFGDYSVQAGQSDYFGQSVQAGVKIAF